MLSTCSWGVILTRGISAGAGEGSTLPSRDITTVDAGDTGMEPSPNSSSDAYESEAGRCRAERSAAALIDADAMASAAAVRAVAVKGVAAIGGSECVSITAASRGSEGALAGDEGEA